jgi:hypothetical protein
VPQFAERRAQFGSAGVGARRDDDVGAGCEEGPHDTFPDAAGATRYENASAAESGVHEKTFHW